MTGGYHIRIRRPGRSAQSGHQPPSLPRVFECAAVEVSTNLPVIAAGEGVCIVGYLFSKARPSQRIVRLEEAQHEQILRSAGKSLISDFWGGYIAIIVDPANSSVSVLRGPSGSLPSYIYFRLDECTIADEAGQLAVTRFEIDEAQIGRFLATGSQIGRATCLRGITELLPGICATISPPSIRFSSYWSPWDFASPPYNAAPSEVADELRNTILDCIERWASCFDGIVLGVSGGLDSSIVASATAGTSNDLRCFTMVGPDADGDERRYASVLTKSLGLPLLSEFYAVENIDVQRSFLPHLPRPIASYFMQCIERAHRALDQEHPIGAFFTGNGGDNIFCNIRTVTPLIDRFQCDKRGTVETWRDLSDLTGSDLRSVFKAAWAAYRHGDTGSGAANLDLTGLKVIPRPAGTNERHPWLDAPPNALAGKHLHVELLTRAHHSIELYPNRTHPIQIAPLLSQPIAELCLSVPSWRWIEGGINRAPARQAFRGILPDELIDRQSKGGPSGFNVMLYQSHRAALHELLKDGILMARGILAPDYLGEPDDPTWRGRRRIQRLLTFGAAEAWARHWDGASSLASQ